MLDKETAQELAKELKIDLFPIRREYLQLLFLKYFYQQKDSDKVYFKGGTALHFLFNSIRKKGEIFLICGFLLSKNIPIDWDLANKKMEYYKKKIDLKKLIEIISKISSSEIELDLVKFLPSTHRDLPFKLQEMVLEKLK